MSLISERTCLVKQESREEINQLFAFQREIHVEGTTDEFHSSPVRRTFCLIVLFDLAICCIFWILYIQVKDTGTTFDKYKVEVVNWTFSSSFFDITLLAGARFTYLEITYGCMKSSYPWFLAVSTACTSLYVIAKAASLTVHGFASIMPYILIVIPFILCWTETIFLIYRVLPKERAAANVQAYYRYLSEQYNSERSNNNSRACTLPDGDRASYQSISDDDQFFSPQQTRPGSPTPLVNKEILNLCKALKENIASICENAKDWAYISGDAVNGFITSKCLPLYHGKIYKIECFLNVSAEKLFKDMVFNVENTPGWNSQVRYVQKIEQISNNIDIIYNLSNEALKGYISARDFVILRNWGNSGHRFYIYMKSCEHDNFPPHPNIVRGENGIGAIILEKSTIDPNQTKCIWIMNNDLKGNRMLQSLSDKAMPKILQELIISLRNHSQRLNSVI